MNKFIYKVGAALATGSLMLSALSGSAFASTTTINASHNGPLSNVHNKVTNTHNSFTGQFNVTLVGVTTKTKVTTGNNTSYLNNNGGAVTSGDVNTTVTNIVGGSNNTMTASPCGCATNTVNITSNDNGPLSTVNNTVNNTDNSTVIQGNGTFVQSQTDTVVNTGGNSSYLNNGSGDMTSGDVNTTVTNVVGGSSNTINPSGL